MNNVKIKISVICILIVTLGLSLYSPTKVNCSKQTAAKLMLPYVIGDWVGSDLPVDKKVFMTIPKDNLVIRNYHNKITQKDIYVAVVVSSNRSHIHDPKICYKLQGFHFEKEQKQKLLDAQTSNLLYSNLQNQKYLFMYWYTNFNKIYSSRTAFFVDYAIKMILNKPCPAYGVVVIYTKDDNLAGLINFSKYVQVIMNKRQFLMK